MILVIIKGDREAGEAALAERKIPAEFRADRTPTFNESHWHVEDQWRTSLIRWFNEPVDRDANGMAPGTLLFYNEVAMN